MSDHIVIEKSPAGRYICFDEILGRGAYKIVYRAYDTHNGIEVAWNSISIQRMSEAEQKAIIKEINMLKELSPQNQNIVKFFNAWINPEKKAIVFITEIALSGTLFDYIKKINKINMRVIKKWCHQILEALAFLHERNIAHRDLKCSNIFINSNTGNIMIGDFGLANQSYSNFHTIIGTPEYMAPEMYEENYDEKVDIYAFGCSLLEMITKEAPYHECCSFGQIYRRVTRGELPINIELIKSQKAKNLIMKCLERNPAKRPTARELLNDPFLNIIEDGDNDDKLVKKTSSGTDSSSSEESSESDDLILDTQESIDENMTMPTPVPSKQNSKELIARARTIAPFSTVDDTTEDSENQREINLKKGRNHLIRFDTNYHPLENKDDSDQDIELPTKIDQTNIDKSEEEASDNSTPSPLFEVTPNSSEESYNSES